MSVIAVALALLPAVALAHGTAPPDAPLAGWRPEPVPLAGLVVTAALWLRGVHGLWRAAGRGRGVPVRHVAAFAAGWLALAVALVSPVHDLGRLLFWVHMTQHELLMLVAAPLLVLSRPLVPLLHGLPAAWRGTVGRAGRARPVRATWRVATTPLVAWTVQAVVLWVWHAPALFQATLSSELVHAAQHVSFLGAALLFWWSLVHGRGGVASYGAAVLYLFTTSAHSGALGALLSLAPRPWYPVYAPTAATFGLTALEDQQLGGLVMWVPAATVYVFAALVMLATWLRTAGREARARLATACVVLLAVPLVSAAGCDGARTRRAAAMTGGDPRRGRVVITSYGCPTCHAIPGVAGADGLVGPPLGGIGQRVFIAGVLPNTPDNMVRWLRDPPGVDRLTAMPNMGVGERDARDIAAYLYALR